MKRFDKVFIREKANLFKRGIMVDSKRVYGVVALMLSKLENLGKISDKRLLKREQSDLVMLQKILTKELK